MQEVYPQLPKLWPQLSITEKDHVLVPLCGKSLDMKWLAEQNYYVIGVEVSKKAIQEFIEGYPKEFSASTTHGFTVYRSDNIELWEGDFLKIPTDIIPIPDVIYDKAALVALPSKLRKLYVDKVLKLSNTETQILLQTFEYKQNEMTGPPFSVDKKELQQLYGERFELNLLHEQSKFQQLSKFQRRGLSSYLIEKVYLLDPL